MRRTLLVVLLAALVLAGASAIVLIRWTGTVSAQTDAPELVDVAGASVSTAQLDDSGAVVAIGSLVDGDPEVRVLDRRTGETDTFPGYLQGITPDGTQIVTKELAFVDDVQVQTVRRHDLRTDVSERLLTATNVQTIILSDGSILLGTGFGTPWQYRDATGARLVGPYDGSLLGAGPAGSVLAQPNGATVELLDPATFETIRVVGNLLGASGASSPEAFVYFVSGPQDERIHMVDLVTGAATSVSLRGTRPPTFFQAAVRGDPVGWDVLVRRAVDGVSEIVSIDPRTRDIDVLVTNLSAQVRPIGGASGHWGYIDRGQLFLAPFRSAAPPTTTPPTSTPSTPPRPTPTATSSGYWLVDRAGELYEFGDAAAITAVGPAPAVAIESTATGDGAWILTEDGIVHTRGAARHHGDVDLAALLPGERVAALSARSSGGGYWVFTDLGRVVAFGDAQDFGSMLGTPLNGPIVASRATPSGLGYWMVGSDGGIFSFGDAEFYGSMGGIPLNAPVVGIAPDPDRIGYWLVASDGGIFAFDAEFLGSMGGIPLNTPVVGAISRGQGYLLLGSDGGVFNFSDLPFAGSLGADPPSAPVVGVAAFSS